MNGYSAVDTSTSLSHHGILGMRWGVRRYQPYGDGKEGKEVGEAARLKQKLEREKARSRIQNLRNLSIGMIRSKDARQYTDERLRNHYKLRTKITPDLNKGNKMYARARAYSRGSDKALNREANSVNRVSLKTLDNMLNKKKSELSEFAKSKDHKVAKDAKKALKAIDSWERHPRLKYMMEAGKGTAAKATVFVATGAATIFLMKNAGKITDGMMSFVSSGVSRMPKGVDKVTEFIDVVAHPVTHSDTDTGYSAIDTSASLSHHGILGMRWGVRRYQPYSAGQKKGKEVGEAARRGEGKTRAEREGKIPISKSKEALKNIDDYTQEEINDLIARLEMRNKLSRAMTPGGGNKEPTSKIALQNTKYVTSILKDGTSMFKDVVSVLRGDKKKKD